MQSLSKAIEQIKDEMGIGEFESPFRLMIRRQDNLIWYYSQPGVSSKVGVPPDEMIAFAKQNASTPDQTRDNLKMFQKLQEQKLHGRNDEIKRPLFTIGGDI